MYPDNTLTFIRHQRQRAPLTDQQRDRGPAPSFRHRPESRPCHFSLDSGLRRSDALREENRRDRAVCAATDLSGTKSLSCPGHLYHLYTSSLPAGRGRQGGFSLPLAIFIIVVMALIGTAMVSLSQTGQRSVASEVQSIRTFYAAETGAQTAVAQLLPLDGTKPGCGAITSPLALTPAELSGCTASLNCEALSLSGDSYYRITSDAQCSFANNDTRRQIEVMVRHPN